MMTYEVEILRRDSQFSSWYIWKVITAKGKSETTVYNRVEKQYKSPYCMIGRVFKQEVTR